MEHNVIDPQIQYFYDRPLGKKYQGKDNYGKPKSDYLKKLIEATDEQLQGYAENMIWLSAYASNNPRSDYHWQADACYDEAQRREKPEIYTRAYKIVSNG